MDSRHPYSQASGPYSQASGSYSQASGSYSQAAGPYSQSSGYVGLLQSQNISYESFASEIPHFSSQQADAPTPPVDRRERRKWTPADDELLISAWLNTSKDPIVGNDQKSGTFWDRVKDYIAETGRDKRAFLHCKQRWHKINDLTNKFCGAHAAAERQMTSGQNDNDVLKMAHDIYFSDHNSKFTLEHAWCVLRYEQKWLSLNPPKPTASGKRKVGETDSQTSATNVADPDVRPEGVKAAKARRNKTEGKSLADYASIWEMKKEDLATKEKLSKLAILDSLIARKDTLSEAEEVVKNKLLALYF
ncbi:glutathione S-transferase T3-like [Raphanus sativus]|uniref:Glutathione S-transferase T3-like n=1 Tax=Raphanus sativus TaxID=3726 RepID=A0A6J0JK36_RAPSA|nr:glutathione S-transferase T3-like [Raphanus sativus]